MSELVQKQLSKIKAVIFDMDGVLVDTEPIHVRAWKDFLDRLNLSYTDAYMDSFVGKSVEQNTKDAFLKYKIRHLSTEEGVKKRNEIYLYHLKKNSVSMNEGVEELLHYCLRNSYQLALATSSPWEQINPILSHLNQLKKNTLNFGKIFSVIVSGQDVQNKKPDPDIYLKVVKNLGLEKNECLAIEDSPAGIESAKKAGLVCVGLQNQYYARDELDCADLLVQSIKEILVLFPNS